MSITGTGIETKVSYLYIKSIQNGKRRIEFEVNVTGEKNIE